MEPTAPRRLSLNLHGAPQLQRAGATALPLERKQAAMLAWVAVQGPTSRARLASLLWPEVDEQRARANLRQRLKKLRDLAPDLLEDSPQQVSLASDVVLEPGSGSLLGQFEYADCDDFARWLDGQRESLLSRRRVALLADVRAAVQTGLLDEALLRADELLALDRESEEAYRTQMEVLYLRGDTAAAIAVWDRCKVMLRQLYGAAPSASTVQLGETVLEAAASAAAAPVAAPVSIPITVLRPPRLIERHPLLQSLIAAWHEGHTLCVCGEAGQGKSRLLAELAASLGSCVLAAARPGDDAVPYTSLSRLLLTALQRFEPALDGPDAQEAARLLPRLRDLLPQPVLAGIETDYERRQCLLAVARLLGQCMALGCRVLVVDDLQFADGASVDALIEFREMAEDGVEAAARLRFVWGARADEVGERAKALLGTPGRVGRAMRVDLQDLGEAGVTELVDSLGLKDMDTPALSRALWRQVGGNPAFVLESVKLLLALGRPAVVDARALPLAPDIVAVIERRIALLSPQARHLAQLAAIAGDSWNVPLAAAALACEPLALSAPLRELEQRQVLYGRHFVHDVIAVAVRRSIAQSVAEFMHRFVADHLDRQGGEPGRAAVHWEACGEYQRAGAAYRTAAAAALAALRAVDERRLMDAAAACYERAGDVDALFDVIEAGFITTLQLGRAAWRFEQIERLEALARTEDQHLRALLRRQNWESDFPQTDSVEAGERAIARCQELGQPALAFEFAGYVAWRLGMWGHHERAMQTLQPHQTWVQTEGTPAQRIEFHIKRQGLFAMANQLQLSISEGLEALTQLKAAGLYLRQLSTLNNLGLVMQWRGDLDDAKAALTEAAQLRDRLNGPGTDVFDLHLGAVLRDRGEYEQARQLLVKGVEELRVRIGQAQGERRTELNTAENYLASLWLTLGQSARAQALLAGDNSGLAPWNRWRRMVLRLRTARWQGIDRPADRLQARTMLETRDSSINRTMLELELACTDPPEAALPVHERLQADPACQARPGLLLHVLARAAPASLALGRIDRAASLAGQACELLLRVTPFDIERAEVWADLIAVLRAVGDEATAGRLLDDGTAWLRQTASEQVAEPWRESFLSGNPANARLLGLSRR